jgi:DNA-binding XRE family transcriptional regulator
MDITLVTTTLAAPLAGQRKRQRSHLTAYRRSYVAEMVARQNRHGEVGTKAKGKLVQTIAAMSQAEVARALGISREAVRQTENRALAKVRAALLPLYLDLCR